MRITTMLHKALPNLFSKIVNDSSLSPYGKITI